MIPAATIPPSPGCEQQDRHIPLPKTAMAVTRSEPQPQWLLDMTSGPPATKPKSDITNPPGFTSSSASKATSKSKSGAVAPRKQPTPEEMDTLKLKKAWGKHTPTNIPRAAS